MIRFTSTLSLFGITLIIFTIVGILLIPTCSYYFDDTITCGPDPNLPPQIAIDICVQRTAPIAVCSSVWDDIQAALEP